MSRSVITDPNLINAPPGWAKVDALLGKYREPTSFGLCGYAGDLNRFWSRYRLAKSFRAIAIDNYTAETAQGYSALFRVFLVYSAFEQFMRIMGTNIRVIEASIAPYHPEVLANAIRSVPDYKRFLFAVLKEVNGKYIETHGFNLVNGRPCNVLAVAAAIRHIFAHGKLTPNSGTGSINAASAISSILSQFMFNVMDGEFSKRLRENGVAV